MRRHFTRKRTGIVSSDRSFHECFHPFSDGDLFVRTEPVSDAGLVEDPEPIASRIRVLVRHDAVPLDVDIPFDFRLL